MTDTPKMSEAELQALIENAAELGGWLVFHDTDSRKNRAGFPDLVLLRPPRLLFIELKTASGRVSPAQRVWLEQLGRVDDITVDLVRPDRADALIRTLLERTHDGLEAAQAVDDWHSERG